MTAPLTLAMMQQARERIRDVIDCTPCPRSPALSEMFHANVYAKLDNLQATGAFKERGAANKLLQLTADQRRCGVVTASAGNHGLGVAFQARRLGIHATVVMSRNAPLIKRANIERYGATVVLHGDNFDEATTHARQLEAASGKVYVHGFDDLDIILGQASLGLELVEQIPGLDTVIVPIGGGGLLAGVGSAVKALRPQAKIIGVEPEGFASFKAALTAGQPVTIEAAPTIADGLAVRCVGRQSFAIAASVVDEIVTVTEGEIAQAILILLEVEKTVVEGAAATTLAALLSGKLDVTGRTVALPLCGGNIDMTMMANIIERGLAKDGRLVCLRTFVNDKPGALATVARIIADASASVKDVHHNRAFGRLEPGRVEIAWTLQTRGHAHIADLVKQLRDHQIQVENPT